MVILLLYCVQHDAFMAACTPASAAPAVTSFSDPRWAWHNGEPPSWSVDPSTGRLTIAPAPGLDYWSKTFYGPQLLVKSDAPSFVADVAPAAEATLTTAFTLHPRAQFDQAASWFSWRTFAETRSRRARGSKPAWSLPTATRTYLAW